MIDDEDEDVRERKRLCEVVGHIWTGENEYMKRCSTCGRVELNEQMVHVFEQVLSQMTEMLAQQFGAATQDLIKHLENAVGELINDDEP